MVNVKLLANDELDLFERKRLEHVVARARLHGLDCRFDRPVGGHHHHRQRGVDALRRLKELESVHARQPEVGQHQVHAFLSQKAEGRFRARGRPRRIAAI